MDDRIREVAEQAESRLADAIAQIQRASNYARRARNRVNSLGVTMGDLYDAVSAAEEAAHEADAGMDELIQAANEMEDELEELEELKEKAEAEEEGRGGGFFSLMM